MPPPKTPSRTKIQVGDFDAARDVALRLLTEKPRWLTPQTVLVAALWNLGNDSEARIIMRVARPASAFFPGPLGTRVTLSQGRSGCFGQALANGGPSRVKTLPLARSLRRWCPGAGSINQR